MSRSLAAFVCCVFLVACRRSGHDTQKVQQAILDRLVQHTGLDVNALDITTTDVKFENNLAYATVSFHPKGDASLGSGMVMKYTLQEQHGQWVVTSVGDSQGHSLSQSHSGGANGGSLPPGHPQVGTSPQPAAGGRQPQPADGKQ